MSNSLTPKDVLLAIYPNIEDNLVDILTKFSKDLEPVVKRKNEKIVQSDKLTNLLESFPRSYNNYSLCVDRFVSFGKRRPNDAITFLLSLLPNQENHDLYDNLTQKLPFYQEYNEIIDLFLYLFFADCAVQLLSVTMKHDKFTELLRLCYEMAPQTYEPYQEPTRILLVKQYSVLFGFLSKDHLPEILAAFQNAYDRSDHILFLTLHRFIRLSTSDKVDFDTIAHFLSLMASYPKQYKKEPKTLVVWAETLCSICSQLNCDGVAKITEQLTSIYTIAMERTHDKNADDCFIVLVGIILQRCSDLKKKYFQEYFQKAILDKVSKPHRTLGCLKAFLTVIRGPFVSKSSSFWEWGKCNDQFHNGIEATHLADPGQDQKLPDSFTSLFFKYFVVVPKIEQYFQVFGEILLNFAARDFEYFTKETAPNLISKMKNDACFLPLSECLSRIVNPDMHFEEWAQTNPRNIGHNINALIPQLFVMLKEFLFRVANNTLKTEQPDSIFSFSLNQSTECPVFTLPIYYQGISKSMKERNNNANKNVKEMITTLNIPFKEKKVDKKEKSTELEFKDGNIETTTIEEDKYITLLSFLPRIVNTSDLATNSIGHTLVSCAVTKSKAISYFAIQVINMLFSVSADSRITIYEIILSALDRSCKSKNANEMCILLLLLNKLFDLSMRPKAPKDKIGKLVQHVQATSISLLCFEYFEVRDLTMNLLERVKRFSSSFGIPVPLFEAINDKAITKKALDYISRQNNLIPEKNDENEETLPAIQKEDELSDYLTPREIASSSIYKTIFNEILPELVLSLHLTCDNPEFFDRTYQTCNSALSIVGRNPLKIKESSDLSLFYNLISVIFCCLPSCEKENVSDLLSKYFQQENTNFKNLFKELNQDLSQVQKLANDLIEAIIIKPKEAKHNEVIENCFNHCSWNSVSSFISIFCDAKNNKNIKSPEFLSALTTVIRKSFETNNLKYSLIASQKVSDILTDVIQLLHSFFNTNNINKEEILNDCSQYESKLTPVTTQICINYANIMNILAKSLCFPAFVAEGPVLLPYIPEFLQDAKTRSIFYSSCIILNNFSHFTKNQELIYVSNSAIANIVAISPIFNQQFQLTPQISQILLEEEKSTFHTLKRSLYYHFPLLIKDYLAYCYQRKAPVANLYFRAICSFFCGDQPQKETRAQMVVRMLSPFKVEEEIKSWKLTDEETELQKNIMKCSGNIIVCCLLYLMDMEYEIRFLAYKLIQRLAPLCLSILIAQQKSKESIEQDKSKCSELIQELDNYAALIYTSYSNVSPRHIVKISKILSKYLYGISESVIEECIRSVEISSPVKIGRIDQTLVFDILNVFIKNITLEDGGYIIEKTRKLSIYTAFTLTEALLNVYKYVNHSSITSYLQSWQKMETDMETTISYLLTVKKDEYLKLASKSVLVYMANTNIEGLCKQLCDRLTYSYWFFTNLQGRLDDDKAGPIDMSQTFEIVLMSLSEIAQVTVEPLIPYLPLLVNFTLLFYDVYPQSRELMFILFSGLTSADNITSLFIGKTKIESLSAFAKEIYKFFIKSKAKGTIHKWGQECIKWVTGCSDLVIAAKAATCFSFILHPYDGHVLQTLIHSLHNVAICKQTDESIHYLAQLLIIINRIIDKKRNTEGFEGLFNFLMKVSLPFMKVPYNNLSIESLCIVGKYIQSNQCEYDEINDLFPYLYRLMMVLDNKTALDGFFLSLFATPRPSGRGKRPKLTSVAFCLFLPRLIACYGAFHNREPFIQLSDDEVLHVLEIGRCIGTLCVLNDDVSSALDEMLANPSDFPFDEFSLRVCKPLCDDPAIVTAAPFYAALASEGDEIMKCSIFSIVTSVLKGCTVRQDANAFLNMMPTASKHALKSPYSSFSSQLMELFVEITGIESPEEIECDTASDITLPKLEWNVETELSFLDDQELPKLPNGNSEIPNPILLVPFGENFWTSQAVKTIRKKLGKIVAQPHTARAEALDSKKDEKPLAKLSFSIPKRVDDFIIYSGNETK